MEIDGGGEKSEREEERKKKKKKVREANAFFFFGQRGFLFFVAAAKKRKKKNRFPFLFFSLVPNRRRVLSLALKSSQLDKSRDSNSSLGARESAIERDYAVLETRRDRSEFFVARFFCL